MFKMVAKHIKVLLLGACISMSVSAISAAESDTSVVMLDAKTFVIIDSQNKKVLVYEWQGSSRGLKLMEIRGYEEVLSLKSRNFKSGIDSTEEEKLLKSKE